MVSRRGKAIQSRNSSSSMLVPTAKNLTVSTIPGDRTGVRVGTTARLRQRPYVRPHPPRLARLRRGTRPCPSPILVVGGTDRSTLGQPPCLRVLALVGERS